MFIIFVLTSVLQLMIDRMVKLVISFFFFFSSRRRHTRYWRDWSSDCALPIFAIDEIGLATGHRYLTVVLDLDSGAVVFVGDGKGADALTPFWKRLRGSTAKIEAVARDKIGRASCRGRGEISVGAVSFKKKEEP